MAALWPPCCDRPQAVARPAPPGRPGPDRYLLPVPRRLPRSRCPEDWLRRRRTLSKRPNTPRRRKRLGLARSLLILSSRQRWGSSPSRPPRPRPVSTQRGFSSAGVQKNHPYVNIYRLLGFMPRTWNHHNTYLRPQNMVPFMPWSRDRAVFSRGRSDGRDPSTPPSSEISSCPALHPGRPGDSGPPCRFLSTLQLFYSFLC